MRTLMAPDLSVVSTPMLTSPTSSSSSFFREKDSKKIYLFQGYDRRKLIQIRNNGKIDQRHTSCPAVLGIHDILVRIQIYTTD